MWMYGLVVVGCVQKAKVFAHSWLSNQNVNLMVAAFEFDWRLSQIRQNTTWYSFFLLWQPTFTLYLSSIPKVFFSHLNRFFFVRVFLLLKSISFSIYQTGVKLEPVDVLWTKHIEINVKLVDSKNACKWEWIKTVSEKLRFYKFSNLEKFIFTRKITKHFFCKITNQLQIWAYWKINMLHIDRLESRSFFFAQKQCYWNSYENIHSAKWAKNLSNINDVM